MNRREFCGTAVAAVAIYEPEFALDCPTCQGLASGELQCIGCGRMVSAASGDPVFNLATGKVEDQPRIDTVSMDWYGTFSFSLDKRGRGKITRHAQMSLALAEK